MARVGASITKSVLFRGKAQEFSNTYYYETSGIVSEGSAIALLDALIPLERAIHSSDVSFVSARCWSAGGTKAENQMLTQRTLTGGGTGVASPAAMDKERAFLIRFRAGVDSKGRPVYLRKWFHLEVGVLNGTSISNGVLANTEQLSSAHRSYLVTEGNKFKDVLTGTAQNWSLVSEKGRPIDGATVAHPYLEHHQLGDMWRG
jgi:hypothetical protein